MPTNPVQNTKANGVLRQGTGNEVAGPAEEFLTPVTITAPGVVHQKSNNGTVIHQVLGDGSQVGPILTALPAAPVAGQWYMVTLNSITYWAMYDGTSTLIFTPSVLVEQALTDSVAVDVDNVTHDGVVEWTVDIDDGAGAHLAFKVLAAAQDATTVDFVVQPGTGLIPHTVAVTRTGGVTTLTITASGAGFTANVRRTTLS